MSKNKVRQIREQLGYTQAELAEKTNLSIRTIQRVESGETLPKGHTLKVLAEALGIDKMELQQKEQPKGFSKSDADLKLRMINLSCLCFVGIPFGNIIIPTWIWQKNRAIPQVDKVGRRIINFQILWTLSTCLLLILSPFAQDFFPTNFTLILWVGLFAAIVNLFFIFKTARSLHQNEYDVLALKIQFL